MMMMQKKNNEKALRSKTVDIKIHSLKKRKKISKKTEPEVDVIETYIDRRRGLRFFQQ